MSLLDLSDKTWLRRGPKPTPRSKNMSNWRNMPGPGDEATWPPCRNDPMDPRTPEALPDDECDLEELTERYSATELAEMFQAATVEANLLRARLRKLEAEPKAKP